jgi:hypothetical protein
MEAGVDFWLSDTGSVSGGAQLAPEMPLDDEPEPMPGIGWKQMDADDCSLLWAFDFSSPVTRGGRLANNGTRIVSVHQHPCTWFGFSMPWIVASGCILVLLLCTATYALFTCLRRGKLSRPRLSNAVMFSDLSRDSRDSRSSLSVVDDGLGTTGLQMWSPDADQRRSIGSVSPRSPGTTVRMTGVRTSPWRTRGVNDRSLAAVVNARGGPARREIRHNNNTLYTLDEDHGGTLGILTAHPNGSRSYSPQGRLSSRELASVGLEAGDSPSHRRRGRLVSPRRIGGPVGNFEVSSYD